MPTIRGTGIQASSASSYVVPWPSGTVAGDTAIIFAAGGWNPSTPSGWTLVSGTTLGSSWNGMVFYKVMTSADITAGSVTVSFSGAYDAVLAIATLVGTLAAGFQASAQANGSGSSSITITGASTDGSLALYFGSNRGASTDTVSRGTMQRQANDGANGSGCLYAETSPPSSVSPTFSYSSAGAGNYQAVITALTCIDYPATTAVPLSSLQTRGVTAPGTGGSANYGYTA